MTSGSRNCPSGVRKLNILSSSLRKDATQAADLMRREFLSPCPSTPSKRRENRFAMSDISATRAIRSRLPGVYTSFMRFLAHCASWPPSMDRCSRNSKMGAMFKIIFADKSAIVLKRCAAKRRDTKRVIVSSRSSATRLSSLQRSRWLFCIARAKPP